MTTASSVPNPFIGPRSFETGEKLYGRERELRALVHLLTAERVVLLYSPSGAGKSSLIKAALIPTLEKKDFAPLPSIRVNQELPPGAPAGTNRYVYSTLLSLEERRAPEERLDEAALSSFSLPDYLQQRALPPVRAAGRDPVLLFDQFEEVLTADPINLAAKHTFFAQLGQALSDRHLWALFAMREDYLAALDPYLAPIPNRFKDTFRLDLLGVEAARLAMQGPAKAAGVVFSSSAATRLADDLRRTRVQRPDGTSEEVLGPYVEPVQLQVVCLRLWEQRFAPEAPRRMPVITPDDISDVGDVDSALAGYYTDRVRAVSSATGVKERTMRDWFDRELITPEGQRSQVMREPGSSAGLDNRSIMGLIDAHLVRGDERHGTIWYELAHDRLVAPIRQNNAAWRQQTLITFQRQALLWEEQGRGEGLLLEGEALAEGERWAEANAAELTEGEQDFLEACRKARAIRQQQERANRHIRQALVGAVVAAILAIGLAAVAIWQGQRAALEEQRAKAEKQQAEKQARIARLRALAAQSLDDQERAPQRSLLLAVATQQITATDYLRQSVGLNTLLQGLQHIGGAPLRGHESPISALAFSPDGRTLATAGQDGTARLWHLDSPSAPPTVLSGHEDAISALAFSPDGRTLATAGQDGTARLWHLDSSSITSTVLRGHTQAINTLAFSPDGQTLATASDDTTARLWRVEAPSASPTVLRGHTDTILTLAFSPDGRFLATGGLDHTARLWRLDTPAPTVTPLSGHTQKITALAFSPDGRTLATGSWDSTTRLWPVDNPAADPTVLTEQGYGIFTLAFSPDGRTLATAGGDQIARLWRLDSPATPPILLHGHESTVTALAFSPDGRTLATGSGDSTACLWQLTSPIPSSIVLRGHEGTITDLAFSPDGQTLATSSEDGLARLWHVSTPTTLPAVLHEHGGAVTALAFSPNGQLLATGNADATVRLWRPEAPDAPPIILRGHTGKITTLAFSPDGRTLASGSDDHTARLWHLDSPTIRTAVLSGHTAGITMLAFSPDGHTLATGSLDTTARLWHLDTPLPPSVLLGHNDAISSLAFSPDGRTLATGSRDTTARLWHLDKPDTSDILRGHQRAILTLAFSPDGHTLATGSLDTTARLWHLDRRTAPSVLHGHTAGVRTLAFSPDGQTLATGSEDETIRLWRPNTSGPSTVLRGHTHWITALAFSPDGHTLASSSPDTTARLWRLDALANPIVLRGHTNETNSLAFSPDGHILATGSLDNTTHLWHLDSAELVQIACATAGRNLSLDEWEQLYDTAVPYRKTCPQLPRHPSVYRYLLAHGQFGLVFLGYQEDRSLSVRREPARWLIAQAAEVSKEAPRQGLLIYLLARWGDPQLQHADIGDLSSLCQAGADRLPTPTLLDSCNRALADASDNLAATYARARLRARLGDLAGALPDLQIAQQLAQKQHQEHTLQDIQRWISDLQAGRDPLASH